MTKDEINREQDSQLLPSRKTFPITPSDTVELPEIPKGIYIGTGGDVTLRSLHGTEDVTYRNLGDASYIYVNASYIRQTGTTATNMIGEG